MRFRTDKSIKYLNTTYPNEFIWMAGCFFLLGLSIQIWRQESLSSTYDQALFLQELWATSKGRFFESSLSSVLSATVQIKGELPSIDYLHIGQHANFLTIIVGAPIVAIFGRFGLPLLQISLITIAGFVLWKISIERLPKLISLKITSAYYLSGVIIGPSIENFHDFCWFPLLGFLIIDGFLNASWRQVLCFSALILLVREDAALTLFSIGLWGAVRRPSLKRLGVFVMTLSFIYMTLVTGWIQPLFDTSIADRFLQEKFSHILQDKSGGPLTLLGTMLLNPGRVINALISPPGKTLAFLITPAIPLALIPLISIDVGLMVLIPVFIALLSQGMSALSTTLRYVMVLVPGLFVGTVLWWQSHKNLWTKRHFLRFWTAAIALGFVITITSNPYRSLSAFVPDSFSPWVHVSPQEMMQRAKIAKRAMKIIPPNASISADTPLLPMLAEREIALRFPEHFKFQDRKNKVHSVDWILAFPEYYKPFIPLFRMETSRWVAIKESLKARLKSGDYGIHYCEEGMIVLKKYEVSSIDSLSCFNQIISTSNSAKTT